MTHEKLLSQVGGMRKTVVKRFAVIKKGIANI